MSMYRIGQRIQFSIRSTRDEGHTRVTLPGVVISEPQQGTRPGTNIAQTRVEVVTLREAADGRRYLKISEEPTPFLALRGAPYKDGLDVDDTGTLMSVATLRQKAYEDLQVFLGNQPAPVNAPEQAPMEPLTDAPLA
jgi:hypothetical protein